MDIGDRRRPASGALRPRHARGDAEGRAAAGPDAHADRDRRPLSAAQLARAGIRAGDLLIATEGGARTIDIRCTAACTIRSVAAGPAIAHAEGHVVFVSS
jgi:hypothetical protein